MKPYPYFSEYDGIADTNLPSMEKVFGYHFYRTSRRQNVTNHGTIMYKFVVPNLDVDYDMKSVLYISPYGECNCGYQSRNDRLNYELDTATKATSQAKPENTKISREEIDKLKNIIKSEKYKKSNPHVYVLAPKLPMDPYKNQTDIACYEEQASENNKQIDWINVREPITEFEMAMFEHTDIHSLETESLLPTIRRHYSSHPSVILGSRLGNPGRDNPPDEPDEDDIDPDRLIVLGDRDIVVEEVFQESSDDSNDEVRTESKENISDKDGSSEDSGVKSEDSEELRKGNSKADAPDTEERRIAKAPVIVSKSDGKLIYHRLRYDDGAIEKKDNGIDRKRSSKDDSKPSTSKYNQAQKKCKICSAEMSKNKRGDVCKKCSERPAKNKVFRFKSVRHKKDDIETRAMRGQNLPSTSTGEVYYPVPSTSNSNKRNRDDSSDVTDAKKFKSSSDNEACLSDLDYDLDISFEVKDVNEREPSNMFFIDFHDPDADLMNVPIGGGLINILLGADTKTRTAIKKLSLRGFGRITDCTLDYLNALKLDLLDVTRTGVSVGAVANFIRQNPMCRVLHESACTCLPNMHF